MKLMKKMKMNQKIIMKKIIIINKIKHHNNKINNH